MIALLFALSAQAATLEERVEKLERAVAELQQKNGAASVPKPKDFTCELRTPFDGTFRATELTEKAAREGALMRCKAEAKGSLYCSEAAVDCGKK